jgi:hypothetical protein
VWDCGFFVLLAAKAELEERIKAPARRAVPASLEKKAFFIGVILASPAHTKVPEKLLQADWWCA